MIDRRDLTTSLDQVLHIQLLLSIIRYAIIVHMKRAKINVNTDYGVYECLFTPDTKGFVVTCPNVRGVVTWGKNLAEAKKMAKEAVELCIESKVQDNVERGLAAHRVSKKNVFA